MPWGIYMHYFTRKTTMVANLVGRTGIRRWLVPCRKSKLSTQCTFLVSNTIYFNWRKSIRNTLFVSLIIRYKTLKTLKCHKSWLYSTTMMGNTYENFWKSPGMNVIKNYYMLYQTFQDICKKIIYANNVRDINFNLIFFYFFKYINSHIKTFYILAVNL